MLEWMKDESINVFFRFDAKSIDRSSCIKYIENAQNSKTDRHYAVVDADDHYLGTVSLKNINEKDKNAEYAIALRKETHGKGYAKKATHEILKIAFLDLGLEKVYLNVSSKNTRAIAFYERYGFTFEGEFVRHVNINGELCNLKWYAFFKEEYQ